MRKHISSNQQCIFFLYFKIFMARFNKDVKKEILIFLKQNAFRDISINKTQSLKIKGTSVMQAKSRNTFADTAP